MHSEMFLFVSEMQAFQGLEPSSIGSISGGKVYGRIMPAGTVERRSLKAWRLIPKKK